MAIRLIEDIPIGGKRLFVRVDFNVPMAGSEISDDTRIKEALPTIRHAVARGARVILASHLGRPDGKQVEGLRLEPIGARLAQLLEIEVIAADDCIGDGVRKLSQDLRDGEILLLENLRFHKEEEDNDPAFCQKLASLADVYINDAFGTAHRKHASTYGMVKHFQVKGMGYLMRKELKFLGEALNKPQRPFVAILGGAKVADKLGVISSLLPKADTILIGGAMAYTFLKAQDAEIGDSLFEADKLRKASEILKEANSRKVELLLPTDHIVAANLQDQAGKVVGPAIPKGQKGFDIGPETLRQYTEKLQKAKTVFWNGPMGVFENEAFAKGTQGIAHALAESNALSVVGGGDSVAAVVKNNLANRISHLSTGGGASLEFVESGTLPGISILE